jgi:hypothetical protein
VGLTAIRRCDDILCLIAGTGQGSAVAENADLIAEVKDFVKANHPYDAAIMTAVASWDVQ